MKRQVLLDTGPLVALLNRRDTYHAWATDRWAEIEPPFLTCEAVLSEACFLLRRDPRGAGAVMELVNRGIVEIPFRLQEHVEPVARLLGKYRTVPMALSDACLVRMMELYPEGVVLTLDADFRLYRRHGRRVVPTIRPDPA